MIKPIKIKFGIYQKLCMTVPLQYLEAIAANVE